MDPDYSGEVVSATDAMDTLLKGKKVGKGIKLDDPLDQVASKIMDAITEEKELSLNESVNEPNSPDQDEIIINPSSHDEDLIENEPVVTRKLTPKRGARTRSRSSISNQRGRPQTVTRSTPRRAIRNVRTKPTRDGKGVSDLVISTSEGLRTPVTTLGDETHFTRGSVRRSQSPQPGPSKRPTSESPPPISSSPPSKRKSSNKRMSRKDLFGESSGAHTPRQDQTPYKDDKFFTLDSEEKIDWLYRKLNEVYLENQELKAKITQLLPLEEEVENLKMQLDKGPGSFEKKGEGRSSYPSPKQPSMKDYDSDTDSRYSEDSQSGEDDDQKQQKTSTGQKKDENSDSERSDESSPETDESQVQIEEPSPEKGTKKRGSKASNKGQSTDAKRMKMGKSDKEPDRERKRTDIVSFMRKYKEKFISLSFSEQVEWLETHGRVKDSFEVLSSSMEDDTLDWNTFLVNLKARK